MINGHATYGYIVEGCKESMFLVHICLDWTIFDDILCICIFALYIFCKSHICLDWWPIYESLFVALNLYNINHQGNIILHMYIWNYCVNKMQREENISQFLSKKNYSRKISQFWEKTDRRNLIFTFSSGFFGQSNEGKAGF